MYDLETDCLKERYELAMERIAGILQENTVPAPFDAYFRRTAEFLLFMGEVREELTSGAADGYSMVSWQEMNRRLYEDILPENYENSYANPAYAAKMLGEEHAQQLCFLYVQLRGLIGYEFEGLKEESVIHLELFLEVYNRFEIAPLPAAGEIRQMLYWFVSDYSDLLVGERIRQNVDPARDFAVRIVMDSDLNDLRYLYHYGEYVTEDELVLADFMNRLPDSKIDRIARTFVDGYRVGFERAGKDLSKKLTVNLRYHLGFERVVRRAVELFGELGLRPVIFRYALSCVNKNGVNRTGFEGANPNRQYDYDHREDSALYLDQRFVERRLSAMHSAFETFQTLANGHAGPAVIETFGEAPFAPVDKLSACRLSDRQQRLQVEMSGKAKLLTNRYIIGEERSFTIIAFPVPQIGGKFEEIFEETLEINTLDAARYEQIQQQLIDALDKGVYAHIVGRNGNRTDLKVALCDLKDRFRQSRFENCLADVNIPLGEVFTTPKLEGTEGLLHVTAVYLNGLLYKELEMTFRDGMVTEYGCANFEDPKSGRDYVRANVLFHHDTLPMGEFAIGTNTKAYVMGRKYGIEGLLPILIAEKTGPHFAVGDTCYCWQEEITVYNPDGKECVARDNSISILRKEDPGKAYFGCHTDITIPYSELGVIEVVDEKGHATTIIRDGHFVLPGTQELNEVLEGEG